MRFDIITIFPKIFNSYFNESILGRAQAKKLVVIRSHDIRKFSHDKHKKASPTGRWSYGRVDDKPYGGGAGMIIQAEPILRAVEDILKKRKNHPVIRRGRYSMGSETSSDDRASAKIIILSAKGKQFTQKMAYDWAKKYDQLILISGRYEGIDERVSEALKHITRKDNISSYSKKYYHSISSVEEISIGPYVLTDGDSAAMVIISAVARLIPGVIKLESLAEESHWNNLLKKEKNAGVQGGGLEYPHYTRPEVFIWKGKTYRVPKILLSGDHKKIQIFREGKRKKTSS